MDLGPTMGHKCLMHEEIGGDLHKGRMSDRVDKSNSGPCIPWVHLVSDINIIGYSFGPMNH